MFSLYRQLFLHNCDEETLYLMMNIHHKMKINFVIYVINRMGFGLKLMFLWKISNASRGIGHRWQGIWMQGNFRREQQCNLLTISDSELLEEVKLINFVLLGADSI